jgi:hypothetical protein
MRSKKIPEERSEKLLNSFVKATFNAGWEMDLLIVLYRGKTKGWVSQALSDELLVDIASIDSCLARFIERGLVTSLDGQSLFRYESDSAEKSALVELLAAEFGKRSLFLRRLIYE